MFSASYQRYSKWRAAFALVARGGTACANATRASRLRQRRIRKTVLGRVSMKGNVSSITTANCFAQKNAGADGSFSRAPASKNGHSPGSAQLVKALVEREPAACVHRRVAKG